jgi:hypothetical protein
MAPLRLEELLVFFESIAGMEGRLIDRTLGLTAGLDIWLSAEVFLVCILPLTVDGLDWNVAVGDRKGADPVKP